VEGEIVATVIMILAWVFIGHLELAIGWGIAILLAIVIDIVFSN
jgi:hypothetical protein